MRPIVRGKAKSPVEFGAKLDISVVNGFTRLEYHSFDAYNEALKLSDMIERYKERTESYPERILADKIYRNRENLAYCAERKISKVLFTIFLSRFQKLLEIYNVLEMAIIQ